MVTNIRGNQNVLAGKRRRVHHTTCCSYNCQVCGEFATTDTLYNNMTFHLVSNVLWHSQRWREIHLPCRNVLWDVSSQERGKSRDFRLQLWSSTELRPSGLLYSEYCNFLPTFWDNLSVPSSGFKNPIGCPETPEGSYHYSLHNKTEEHSSEYGKMYYELITNTALYFNKAAGTQTT